MEVVSPIALQIFFYSINEPRTIMYVKEVWTKSHPERETIIYVISTE